jgi:hypothetical protein
MTSKNLPRKFSPPAPPPRRSLLDRLLGRRKPQPTVFHRCLAVHMHYAKGRSALS